MVTVVASNEVKPGTQGRLVPEQREAVVKRLQALFSHIPKDVSLVDELIADRQAEAARESSGE